GHHCDHHRFGAAAGDDEMFVWIDGESGEALNLFCESRAEFWRAPGDGVLMVRTTRGAFEGVEQFDGRIKVRKPLGEIDRAVLVGQARHAAND
ncbi:MAG: hypothetical protein JWM68_4725, partial [Verrucomicrobiales bacterium]|nr:hypothetical protein [Verrucomicrobiales bacterium]